MLVVPLTAAAVMFLDAHALAQQEVANAVRATVDLGPQIAVTVPIAPTPVPIGNHLDLVYELHLTNYDHRTLTLQKLEVLGGKGTKPIAMFEGDALTNVLGPGEPDADLKAHTLAPRQLMVVYLWLELSPHEVPTRLSHRLTFGVESQIEQLEGAAVNVAKRPPIAIGPPVRGGNWIATNIGNDTVHRRLIVIPEQEPVIGTRFATDWCKKGENGWTNREHTPLRNEDVYCYGEEVIAVSDSTVASVVDGIAENQHPDALPPSSNWRTLTGNRVILDLGGDVFAIYAHLQPGSIKVKPGQRVRRGETLGLIGNSGFSEGPHLHFQLANAEDLAGEGLPYVLGEYDSFGINVGGEPLDSSKRHRVQGKFPEPDEVVAFPAK